MSGLTRREALRLTVLGSAAVAGLPRPAGASPAPTDARHAAGLLFDATRCIGCKACVAECARVNDLPPDTELSGGLWQMPLGLNARTRNVIQVAGDPDGGEDAWCFVKRQCMHCLDAPCVSGCPFTALYKDEHGIVRWNGDACVGCRFCEVACPWQVPKFEWHDRNPAIVKCELCAHRVAQGEEPGCSAVCPTDAVIFGERGDLLAEAKRRIAAAPPGTYHENRVYGEHEGGGTQVLYLSALPFETLGLPTLGPESNAHFATEYQARIYKGLMIPAALYGVLATVVRRRFAAHREHAAHEEAAHGLRDQL